MGDGERLITPKLPKSPKAVSQPPVIDPPKSFVGKGKNPRPDVEEVTPSANVSRKANKAPTPTKRSINTSPQPYVHQTSLPLEGTMSRGQIISSNQHNAGFYHPRDVRNTLEQRYPGQVTSSTIPEPTAKNVRLAGQRHPETGIVFDNRGYPIFDSVVKFDTRIPFSKASIDNGALHKRAATKSLREAIHNGQVRPTSFNEQQLAAIQQGKAEIPEFTWHHHQESGRMQLIPQNIHNETGHVGGMSIWPFNK